MKQIQTLFATHKFVHIDQGCIGRNALPFAHDTLRIDDFASQHGASVHRELQNMNGFFAAIHFHVSACRNIKSTALRFLRRSVIEQAPKRANRARSFDAGVINVDGARIGGRNPLPFSLCGAGSQEASQCEGYRSTQLTGIFQALTKLAKVQKRKVCNVHKPYYKVVALT